MRSTVDVARVPRGPESPHDPNGGGRPPWWRQLWVLVLAGGLVMGVALGIRHVQGLFLLPITLDRGWTRETFSLAIAIQNLVWGLAQPFTGMVADRWGAPRVIGAGLLLQAIGLLGMAFAPGERVFVVAAGILVGIALSGTTFGVVYGALSRLIEPSRRSAALGLAGAIGGVGQFVLVPGTQSLLSGLDWDGALLALAVIALLLLPCALPLRDVAVADAASPADDGSRQSMRAALAEAFRHRGFWLLNFGFVACGFQLAFIASHLPAYLVDRGMTPAQGMLALALIALGNIGGTWWFGVLGGRFRRKHVLAGIYLARTAAMALFVLLPLGPVTLYLFAAAMGWLWLGTVPLTNGLVSQVFGVRYIATLFGFVFLGHQIGGFLGVWLGGYLFDRTGSYELVWFGAMALGIAAALLHMPIDDRAAVRSPAARMAA